MTATKKLMDYLARREHSELELKEKLLKTFSPEEVEAALTLAREKNWLVPPVELAEKVAADLHRKFKGIEFINGYLDQKGLPNINFDSDLELEKARHLVENKSKLEKILPQEKVARLLTARGYDSETIRKVLHEKR